MNKNQNIILRFDDSENYQNFNIIAHHFVTFRMIISMFSHLFFIRNHFAFSHRSFSSICTTIFLFLIIIILNQNNHHHVASQAMPASPSKYDLFYTFSFFFTYIIFDIRAQTEIGRNITKILNTILDKRYDKRVRPDYAGPPVEVGVTMYIISISSVSEVQMVINKCLFY